MAGLPERHLRGAYSREQLAGFGVTPHELRGPFWRSVHHGRYQWALGDGDSPVDRILAAFSILPRDGALGGWAAAYYHGARELDGRRWDGEPLPVQFVLPTRLRVRRSGIVTTRAPLEPDDVVIDHGKLITNPARTCFDLMRLGSVQDAVVALDAMLRADAVRLDDVRTYVASHRGWKGVRTARTAVELADPAARSCPESRFRVIWIVDAGLPRPLVNHPVRSRQTGRLLGIPDLLDPESGLVGEYDGAHHRRLANHADDNVREERLEAHNLTVVRATSLDVFGRRPELVRRSHNGYRRARQRNPRRDRWAAERYR